MNVVIADISFSHAYAVISSEKVKLKNGVAITVSPILTYPFRLILHSQFGICGNYMYVACFPFTKHIYACPKYLATLSEVLKMCGMSCATVQFIPNIKNSDRTRATFPNVNFIATGLFYRLLLFLLLQYLSHLIRNCHLLYELEVYAFFRISPRVHFWFRPWWDVRSVIDLILHFIILFVRHILGCYILLYFFLSVICHFLSCHFFVCFLFILRSITCFVLSPLLF